jgi:sec-independent protein translocase protein TatB
MFGLGFTEILIILVVALLVLGPKKLPEIAKQLGKGLREFRRATDDLKGEFEMQMEADADQAARARAREKDQEKPTVPSLEDPGAKEDPPSDAPTRPAMVRRDRS